MPGFGTVRREECGRGDRLTDYAIIEQFAAGLQRAAQEGVGRAADAQSRFCREIDEQLAVGAFRRQWFFGVDRLTGVQCGHADFGVRGRDGQVENHIDIRIRQQLLDGVRADVELFRPLLGALVEHVGDGDHLDIRPARQILQIDFADHPASDDANPGSRLCHLTLSLNDRFRSQDNTRLARLL